MSIGDLPIKVDRSAVADFCSKLNRHLRPLVEREMLVIYEQP